MGTKSFSAQNDSLKISHRYNCNHQGWIKLLEFWSQVKISWSRTRDPASNKCSIFAGIQVRHPARRKCSGDPSGYQYSVISGIQVRGESGRLCAGDSTGDERRPGTIQICHQDSIGVVAISRNRGVHSAKFWRWWWGSSHSASHQYSNLYAGLILHSEKHKTQTYQTCFIHQP